MKKRSAKNRHERTLKIADIDSFKTLGCCPTQHKGLVPCPISRLWPTPVLTGSGVVN